MFKLMAKTKEQKQTILSGLKQKLSEQKSIVFVDFSKVDSKTLFKLRDNLKAEGGCITVVKKTLLKRALQALDKKGLAKKIDEIKGQLALVFGFSDEVTPSRLCYEAAKENEAIKILGGVLAGEYQGQERIIELAQLPTKQVLLGRLVGSLASPMSGFARALKGNLSNLVCALSEIQKVK